MVWQGTLYMILVLIVLSVSIASALHIWRHRYMPAAKTLIVILLAGTTWILADMLYWSSTSQPATIFALKIAYPPLAIVYIGWFVFTLQYTGRGKWVTRRNLVLLSVIPAITLPLILTIDYHHLMCSSLNFVPEGEFLREKCTYGPWFYIQAAYAYILVLFGDFLLIHLLIHAPRFYRRQIISLLLVSVLLQLRSVLPMSGLSSLSVLTIVTMLFSVGCPLLALSIYRFRLADIVPVARGRVIEGMDDGVMVLDAQNRVLDVNPIIQKLIGHHVSRLLGHPVAEIWPSWIQIEPGNEIQEGKEITLNLEDGQHVYDVRFSPLTDWRGSLVSQVVALRDITDQKQTEMQLKNIFDASKLINSTIDINEIFEFVSKSVQELVGFDHFMVFLVSKDRNHIYRACAVGDSEDEKKLSLQYGEGLIGHCITKKEIILLRNAYTDERAENIPDAAESMSQIVIPLIIENEAVGALHISKSVENAYGNHDVDVLKPLSEIISSAIRNSSLYTETKEFGEELEKKVKERSRRIKILVDTRQNLQRETSLQKGLTAIVDSMEEFGFDRVGIFLVDPTGEKLNFHVGKGFGLPETGASVSLKDSEYYGVQCVLEKKTIHVKDARLTEGKQITESTSFVWVPIILQDEAFAALAASNLRNEIVTDEDVKDLEILAGMCAAFIDRTRVQIEPVAENNLQTEISHQLISRECYLILEKTPEKSFEIFVDLVTHGISGFVVSRDYPEKIKEKYHLVKTPMLWLSRAEREIAINPDDLPKLIYIIGDFTGKSGESVVLLDGLEYLIIQNTFEAVLKFLQELKDIIILNNSRLILPLHKETLSQKEYSKIEREFPIFD